MNNRIIYNNATAIPTILDYYKSQREKLAEAGKRKSWRHDTDGRCDRHIRSHMGHLHAEDITRSLCMEYEQMRQEDGVSTNTIRLELAHLRAALNMCAKDDRYEGLDTAPSVYVPTSNAYRDVCVSREDFIKIVKCSGSAHVKLYLILAWTTAARPSHILSLHWSQVDFDLRVLHLAKPGEMVSNKRKAVLPINEDLMSALTEMKPLARTDFIIEHNGKPVNSIRNGVKRAAERAGFPEMSQYAIRHSAASHMAMSGVPLEQIALYMGDDVATVRKHYLHLTAGFMAQASQALRLSDV